MEPSPPSPAHARPGSACTGLALAAALLLATTASGCELVKPVQPKAPCSSDGECESRGNGDRFCIQGGCVQCLTSESCGGDNLCIEGKCYTPCKTAKECPAGRACTDGLCLSL